MIDIILNVLGIILLIYSILLCAKILILLGKNNSQASWKFLCFLIILFLIGYCFHLYLLITPQFINFHKDLLVSLIMFFGAVFVVSVLEISKKQILILNNDKKQLELKNSELLTVSKKLKREHEELEKVKCELEKKNENLKDNLDDFYTLKLDLKQNKTKIK